MACSLCVDVCDSKRTGSRDLSLAFRPFPLVGWGSGETSMPTAALSLLIRAVEPEAKALRRHLPRRGSPARCLLAGGGGGERRERSLNPHPSSGVRPVHTAVGEQAPRTERERLAHGHVRKPLPP